MHPIPNIKKLTPTNNSKLLNIRTIDLTSHNGYRANTQKGARRMPRNVQSWNLYNVKSIISMSMAPLLQSISNSQLIRSIDVSRVVLHSVFVCPILGQLVVPIFVGLVHSRYLWY